MFGSFLRKAGRYQGIIASDGHSQGKQQIVLVEVSAALNHEVLVVCEELLSYSFLSTGLTQCILQRTSKVP